MNIHLIVTMNKANEKNRKLKKKKKTKYKIQKNENLL